MWWQAAQATGSAIWTGGTTGEGRQGQVMPVRCVPAAAPSACHLQLLHQQAQH